MNLHAIVSGAIAAVNPFVSATVQRSSGYVTNIDGSRTPTYTTFPISAQLQALTYSDLTQLDALNIQGTRRAMYVSGQVFGLLRVDKQGGDLVVFPQGILPEGTTWLCAHVLEAWNDSTGGWCKIALTLQDGS